MATSSSSLSWLTLVVNCYNLESSEKKLSIEKLPRADWPVDMTIEDSLDCIWCPKAYCGWHHPYVGGPKLYKKISELKLPSSRVPAVRHSYEVTSLV